MSTFSKYEIQYLTDKRPDLVPMEVPSLSNAPLLTQPSVDQIILKFLAKYEVNVKPRNVGEWNGWDTMYTFTRIFAKENSTLNIASTMFYTNRSNQINSAAQDWGIWKRWALDHENFNQFKSELVQSIDFYNKKVIEETKTKIRIAETHNYKALLALREPSAKEYISELRKQDELKRKKKRMNIMFSFIGLIGFISFAAIMEVPKQNARIAERKLRNIEKLKIELMSNKTLRDAENSFLKSNFNRSLRYYSAVLEDIPQEFSEELYPSSKNIIKKYIIASMKGRYFENDKFFREDCGRQYSYNRLANSFNNLYYSIVKDKIYWENEVKKICFQKLYLK